MMEGINQKRAANICPSDSQDALHLSSPKKKKKKKHPSKEFLKQKFINMAS
jgi:hypothetical protein